MERNYEFEIEFLIGALAVAVGAAAISPLKAYIDTQVSYVLITISVVHISLLIVIYSLRRGTHFAIPAISYLDTASAATLWLTTFGLLAFLFNVVTNTTIEAAAPNLNLAQLPYVAEAAELFGVGTRDITALSVTILLTIVMGAAIWGLLVSKARIARDIEYTIIPDIVKVRGRYRDSRPLAITLKNESPKDLTFNVKIEFPRYIYWREAGKDEEKRGKFERETTISSGREEPIDLEFRHDLSEGESRSVDATVSISHDYGSAEDGFDMLVDSY